MPSILRNPSVANNLYLSADIEKWGSGLKRISKECKANSVKVEFKVLKYGFTVQFSRPKTVPENVPENVLEKVTEKVTENQMKIIAELKKDKYVTSKYLASLIGMSERKIKDNLKKLKGKGILKRIGPDKGGHWEILK